MYVDKLLLITESQDLGDSQSPATVLCENSVDLGAAKDLSKGKQMYVVIIIDESFVGNTSVKFEVITDNPDQVATYQGGKTTIIGWFVGQVMKKSRGKADPQLTRSILEELLSQ